MPRFDNPRRCATSDIKLLRLDLFPRGDSVCDDIGCEWSPAQPTENLSPARAAEVLKLEEWALPSQVRKRFRLLQLRYPPEQFPLQHVEWHPSAELLGNPRARLNWYWQSGLIPVVWSEAPVTSGSLWDAEAVESPMDPLLAFARLERYFTTHSPHQNQRE